MRRLVWYDYNSLEPITRMKIPYRQIESVHFHLSSFFVSGSYQNINGEYFIIQYSYLVLFIRIYRFCKPLVGLDFLPVNTPNEMGFHGLEFNHHLSERLCNGSSQVCDSYLCRSARNSFSGEHLSRPLLETMQNNCRIS